MNCCCPGKALDPVESVNAEKAVISEDKVQPVLSTEQTAMAAYKDEKGFTTIALHNGHKLDTDNRARAVPIYQTTSFEFKSAEHGAALFSLSEYESGIQTMACGAAQPVDLLSSVPCAVRPAGSVPFTRAS